MSRTSPRAGASTFTSGEQLMHGRNACGIAMHARSMARPILLHGGVGRVVRCDFHRVLAN
eukprot:6139413-Pyramimonas_sp.AAC.1